MAEPITWLRFEESFFDPHPKVYRLAAALGIPASEAAVQVAKLWFFVARYDRSDYLGRITEHVDQLENQVLVAPKVTVADLVAVGLVDADGEGHLYVHDWNETNGRHLAKYARERERKRKARGKAAEPSADTPRIVLTPAGDPSAERPTLQDGDGTGQDGTGPDVDGGGRGGTAEPVENAPTFPQADVVLQLPALRNSTDPDPVTFQLRRGTVDSIQATYPTTDVMAVAHDMNRKLRAGARDLYTVRGMPKALASWVAQAAAADEHRREP